MRRILVIVLIMTLVCTVVACGNNNNKQELVKSSFGEVNNLDGISITETDSSFKTTLMFRVTNDLDQNALISSDFIIEKFADGDWYTIPYTDNRNHSLTSGAIPVYHNQYSEGGANWGTSYGDLSKGKYRMIKEVQFSDYDENNPNDIPNLLLENDLKEKYYLSCEFEIE